MAVRWLYIRTVVVWGASLGGLNSMVTISKLWFNSIDQSIESFVVFAGWLFERRSSGSGNGPLLPACLPACLPVSVSDSNRSLRPFTGYTFEQWLSGAPP